MRIAHIKQMIADFKELRSIVNNFEGEFSALREELNGDRMDYDIFGVTYKSISTSVYIILGTYFVSSNIVVFDSDTHEMKRMLVSDLEKIIKHIDRISVEVK